MHGLALDLRFALRRLIARPGATVLALLTLALGIGATSAIFSVVKGVLLDPLPFAESDRLVRVYARHPAQGVEEAGLALGDYFDLRRELGAFDSISGIEIWNWYGLDYGLERPRSLTTIRTSPGMLDLLGVAPVEGRLFREDEDRDGREKVVILSWSFWQEELGGRTPIAGEEIVLDREPWTIVGVMPRDFAYPHPGQMVWVPWAMDPEEKESRRGRWVNTVARLADGATVEGARAELTAFAAGLEAEHPDTNEGWTLTAVPMLEATVGSVAEPLWSLHFGVVLLLLIAAANVASLSLIRGLARRSEMAVRTALGAGRAGMVRLLLTESLLLTLVGGALGLLLATWSLEALVATNLESLPRVEEIGLDPAVLLLTLGVSIGVGLVVGLFPVVQALRDDVVAGLGDAGRGPTSGRAAGRVRHALVVAELALSLMLVVGAGLLGRSFLASWGTDPGFDREGTLAVQLFAWDGDYEQPESRLAFFDRLTERWSAVPGVEAVGGVSALPFSVLSAGQAPVRVDGRAEFEAEHAGYRIATPDWIGAMGIPLLAGRNFDGRDRDDAVPVVVVSRTAAERWFGGVDAAVGERVSLGRETLYEIVGVIEDFRDRELELRPRPEVLRPHFQNPTGTMTFVLATEGDPEKLVPMAREVVWEADVRQAIFSAFPVADALRAATERRRVLSTLAGVFAATALFLAVVGLYGALSWAVRSRHREMGIRLSVGARGEDLIRLVLGEGTRLVLVGLAVGALGAIFVGSWLRSQLYGVSAVDPLTWALAVAALAVTGLAASAIPAWRAGRVDPVESLREG